MGGGDYSVFANGQYSLSGGIMDLHDWLERRLSVRPFGVVPKDAGGKE